MADSSFLERPNNIRFSGGTCTSAVVQTRKALGFLYHSTMLF